jgi:uncharacterized coiled-coil protein SlyX
VSALHPFLEALLPAATGLMIAYLPVAAGRGAVWRVPEVPGRADDAAGLRAANARLRELLGERNARIAEQDAEIAVLREHLAGLQSQVADLAAQVKANSRNSSKPPSSDGLAKPSPKHQRLTRGRRLGEVDVTSCCYSEGGRRGNCCATFASENVSERRTII